MSLYWLVALTAVFACTVLGRLLLGDAGAARQFAPTLAAVLAALSGYAWGLYPVVGSLALGVGALLCLVWAWAVLQTAALGWTLAAFGVLTGTAAWQRRLRDGRLHRLRRALEELGGQRTVKRQAIAQASQTAESLHKKLARYAQLQTVAEALSNLTDRIAIASLAVERAFDLIGKSDVCLLFLVDSERQELSLVASQRREGLPSVQAKHGDQFDRHVLRSHLPLLVSDTRRDFRFTVAVAREREIGSVIACPLMAGESPAGVLRLDSAAPGAYTQDDLRFLDILLDLIATALTNARLFARTQQLAVTDSLTGLTLRRPFMEQLSRELARAGRSREPVSLLMLDVDHFKAYNDTFGHIAGDVVLRRVADVLRAVVPPGGTIGRYGGEEFVVLLPGLARHQAGEVAERVRRTVERELQGAPREAERRALPAVRARQAAELEERVTVSVGLAAFPDDAAVDLELLRLADQRLYQAKHAGRNVVVYK